MHENAKVTVRENSEQGRYEAVDESGQVVGFAAYEQKAGLLVFTHTEVPDAVEGQGVGSMLAHGALEGARSTGLQVRPACPFIADYIERHPEFQDLLSR
jgi:predicted GNAT family acetyltransferase